MDGFDGVTIAEFDADMKICDLKEFQSKAEHYYPYGVEKEHRKTMNFEKHYLFEECVAKILSNRI